MIRAGLYARVSTVGHGQDVELQLGALRTLAQHRGWLVVGPYVDEGVSGAKERRPGLDRLVADARTGKLDVVAVWRLDRLGRSLQHLLRLISDFAAQKVAFVSICDSGIDTTTPSGMLLMQILGAFAEFERALIRDRTTAGVRHAQAAGVHCGRPSLEVDVARAKLLLALPGQSLSSVAAELGVSRATLRRRVSA